MESDEVDDKELMLERTLPSMQIDPGRARFPCCVVWAPLPFISWLVPFIGHIGICREDGVILDFAGPNFVCVDSFAFGAAARYIQINREKCYFSLSSNGHPAEDNFNEAEPERKTMWDDALRKSTQEFQHRSYSLFTCNCHCFVANSLNRMHYGGHNHWNVVNLAAYIFLKGHWVNKTSIVRSYLPFTVVVLLGILLGGLTFLIGLAVFAAILVSWFIIGGHCDALLEMQSSIGFRHQ